MSAIQVIDHCFWSSGGGVLADQKLWGQVTKCSLNGHVFYVRENLDGAQSFYISSGQRWGEKGGNGDGRVMDSRQILDLWAPPALWDWIVMVVQAHDRLNRPVRRHRCFTPAWAERLLAEKRRTHAARHNDPRNGTPRYGAGREDRQLH